MDHVYEYMKHNGLVTGDRGKDRRTYVELNFFGDVDPRSNSVGRGTRS